MKSFQSGIVLLLVLLLSTANAQQLLKDAGPGSLERALKEANIDTAKAVALQKLSDYWLYKDSTKAMHYATQIFDLAKPTSNAYIRGIGHYQLGGVYMEHYDLDSAEKHHLEALRLLDDQPSWQARQYLAKTWHNYGAIFQRRGDNKEFLDNILNKAVPILEEIGDTLTLGADYLSVGQIFMNNKEWDNAQRYYQKAINLLEKYPQYEYLPMACIDAARGLIHMEDNAPEQTRKIRSYLDQAQRVLSVNPESQCWIPYFTANGMYYQYREEIPEKALENYERGIALADKLQNEYDALELLNRKYYLYYNQQQYALAKTAGYDLYNRLLKFSIPKNQMLVLRNLVELEEKTGNPNQALALLHQYVTLSDSVNVEEARVNILELEKKFEHEKKENEILQLKNESNQRELKLQHARSWGYLLGGLALLFAGGLFAGVMLYRNKQQIARQKEQLHKQEMEKLKQERRMSNFSAMLEGQEQERKRVASELHDGLGGSLAGIKLRLSQVVVENEGQNRQLVTTLSQLDDSVAELRRIARNLMPETLLRHDLTTALKEFCRSMGNEQTKITFQAYGLANDDIPQTMRMMLYRIVQELLTNALKHAKASMVLIQMTREKSTLSLTVEDDGIGFNPNSKTYLYGLGLSTIKNRVDYLKGDIEILSEFGTGTTVNITIDTDSDAISNPIHASHVISEAPFNGQRSVN
ncbi:tetratricopeptide repeat-containing sensor histidine kinase [Parapedobacter tibetensis]|uniref:tetratricopeptide repeat-containing sensor histidine kinase n=1 Tax=Parapedobacter tibetensis TaxID=2972951 RepID=UPI00214D79A1|nr:sensor histidine kinase [Parapedobacter tibetensis]